MLGWMKSSAIGFKRKACSTADAVVVEWIEQNRLAHDDPNYAPVGNYMFTIQDDCARQVR